MVRKEWYETLQFLKSKRPLSLKKAAFFAYAPIFDQSGALEATDYRLAIFWAM